MMREELLDIRADVAYLKIGVSNINITLKSHDQRLTRVEENTAVSRRILEKNELTERSGYGRRLVKVESGMQKIGLAASSVKS